MTQATTIAFSEEIETLLLQLEESTTQQGYSVEVPERLTQVIADTALIGVTCYRWSAIRALVLCKLAQVIREFGEPSSSTLDTRVAAIATALVRLPEAPFTLQRICEILEKPRSFFSNVTKMLNALDRLSKVKITEPNLSAADYNQVAFASLEMAANKSSSPSQATVGASSSADSQDMSLVNDDDDADADSNGGMALSSAASDQSSASLASAADSTSSSGSTPAMDVE